jgi:hypothetical protein
VALFITKIKLVRQNSRRQERACVICAKQMHVRNQSARHSARRRTRYALLQPRDADRKVAEEEGNCDFRLNFGGKPFDDLIDIFSGILPDPGIGRHPSGRFVQRPLFADQRRDAASHRTSWRASLARLG